MTGLEAVALTHSRGLMLSWDRPSTRDWAKVLETFPLFSAMSKRRLRKLVRKATRGRNSDSLYLILGGAATARDPGAQVLSVGDYFGDAALNGRTPRSTTVVARQELHVMRLQRQSLLRLGFARLAPQGRARFALTRRP
jgi:CRP-like cAMP-binding protein